MKEYKSFYKTVTSGEGDRCHYPTRLDTYGCGCFHNCKYCYAKSLLSFRNLWDDENPAVADIKKIENKIKTLEKGSVIRLGGMTDCFQPCENEYNVTYKTIQLLNKYGIHYLIVTKSNLVASDKYMKIMNRELAHIQITVTSTDDKLASSYERATPPSLRMIAIKKLQDAGFDVQIRLSPFIPEYLDMNIVCGYGIKRAIIEFLRVNTFIKNTFDGIDYSKYTLKEGGYNHLPLTIKKDIISSIKCFDEISVCEDSSEAYEYWKQNVNYNKNDCCNLKFCKFESNNPKLKSIGNVDLLKEHKIAFLCSSNYSNEALKLSENWAKRQAKNDCCVVSGFQSKVEQSVLNELLNGGGKIVMILAKSMFKKCPQKYKKAVSEGRMLIISSVDDDQTFTTRETAEKRNRQTLEYADSVVVGCIKRNGMTEKLINEMKKPCFVLDTTRME